MSEDPVKEWLMATVKELVAYPDDVRIERSNDEMGVLFVLKVNLADTGRVIGRGGEMAKSIRYILRALGTQYQQKVSMKIDAPYKEKPAGQRRDYGQVGESAASLGLEEKNRDR